MIRIITWLWRQPQGRVSYTADHVNIFASMVRRNCSLHFSLGCVTDMPEGIDPSIDIIAPPRDFEDVSAKWGPRKPNCFRRLSLYRRDAAKIFGGKRIASFDLDCVIGGDLAPILSRPEPLVFCKGTAPERPYNGSLQLLTAGCHPELYEDFDQAGADASGEAFHGSDQAWLAHKLGWNEPTWGEADGVWFLDRYLKNVRKVRPRALFFPGKSKPWVIAPVFPYMRENYRIMAREAA